MQKIKNLLKAFVVISVVLAFVLPGSAVIANNKIQQPNSTLNKIKSYKVIKPTAGRTGNIQITNAPGDDIIPGITKDAAGNTVVTWTNEQDLTTWNMGIAYSATPTDPTSWKGYLITLSGTTMIYSSDTAYINGPTGGYKGLYGVDMYYDTQQVGYYQIEDVTADPSDTANWQFYTWNEVAQNPTYITVEDQGYYTEHANNNYGPVNMAIYDWTTMGYNISDCPMYWLVDFANSSGTTFFDAQSHLWTAPAKDPAMAMLPGWFHLAWQYHNATANKDQIVWKKIDASVEADIEFTPYQKYIADGTNPEIAAYQQGAAYHVAVVYVNSGDVKCVYSADDGDNWSTPVTVASGSYPALCAVGTKLYCAYIEGGNLFIQTSLDGGATWGTATRINAVDGTVSAEENSVDIHSAGIVWVDTQDSDKNIYYAALPGGTNNPPGTPTINGPASGKFGTSHDYTFNAVDPDGDNVLYMINWGDGKTDTTALNPSGTGVIVSHTWAKKGSYTITAKAQDSNGLTGPQGSFSVTMPRSRTAFIRFIDYFQHIFPNLWKMLGL